MVKIYGCSDDYVVIEGSCYEKQIDCYEKDVRIYFWDGTVIRVGYCKPNLGVWYIIVEDTGTAPQSLKVCQDEDAEIYSDVFEIESEIMSHELVKPELPNSSPNSNIIIEEDF